jgi:hypothetical protein
VRRPAAALLAWSAIACSGASGYGDPKPAPDPGTTTKAPTAPSKAAMEIIYQDLPDDRWRRAAEVAANAWREPLTTTMAARAVLRPFRSPDGAAVPYLVRVEATRADGSPGYRATAAVLGDRLANGGGPAAATAWLAAAGFPATRISLGHLLELIYVTGAIDVAWFAPPSAAGWDGVARPLLGTDLARSLEYTKIGAVLHLYRGVPSSGGGGGGFTPPSYERLDATFTEHAAFTTTVLRQNAARTAWEVVR